MNKSIIIALLLTAITVQAQQQNLFRPNIEICIQHADGSSIHSREGWLYNAIWTLDHPHGGHSRQMMQFLNKRGDSICNIDRNEYARGRNFQVQQVYVRNFRNGDWHNDLLRIVSIEHRSPFQVTVTVEPRPQQLQSTTQPSVAPQPRAQQPAAPEVCRGCSGAGYWNEHNLDRQGRVLSTKRVNCRHCRGTGRP
jgi:hypothetical protein